MSFLFWACFVVRDLKKELLSYPPPPKFWAFFPPYPQTLFNTSDSYLKSVRPYDITTWVDDLIDAHIQ